MSSITPSKKHRPVSMMLSGNFEFIRFNPLTAPKTVTEIRNAAQINDVAQTTVKQAQDPVKLDHLTLKRPKFHNRRPTKAIAPKQEVSASSTSEEIINFDTIKKDSSKLSLSKRIKIALGSLFNLAEKKDQLDLLKKHLIPFYNHPEFIPGGAGFTDDFILDVAAFYKATDAKTQNIPLAFFPLFYNTFILSALNSRKECLIANDEAIRAFATKCYVEIGAEMIKDLNTGENESFFEVYSTTIFERAEQEGLLAPAQVYAGFTAEESAPAIAAPESPVDLLKGKIVKAFEDSYDISQNTVGLENLTKILLPFFEHPEYMPNNANISEGMIKDLAEFCGIGVNDQYGTISGNDNMHNAFFAFVSSFLFVPVLQKAGFTGNETQLRLFAIDFFKEVKDTILKDYMLMDKDSVLSFDEKYTQKILEKAATDNLIPKVDTASVKKPVNNDDDGDVTESTSEISSESETASVDQKESERNLALLAKIKELEEINAALTKENENLKNSLNQRVSVI